MLGQGLSPKEIANRLVRLRNLEYLHKKQKIRLIKVLDENKGLRARVLELETIVSSQQKTIEDLKLQMEELRSIIFGKKRKKEEDNDNPDDDLTLPKEKTERTADSYKRPIPKGEEVTETKDHPSNECNKCHSKTTKKKTAVYYEEDIPIPTKKIVRKHIVEKSYCPLCRKWNTSVLLPAHRVMLGENVQRYICYLSVICRLSFSQIQNILSDTFDLGISQGEIAKILNREAMRLRPFYEQLKVKIRGEPSIHLDETSWSLFIGDGYQRYAWTMSGGESKESVFILGKTRGKGNVADLIRDSSATLVSDDYGAYQKIDNPHQLCCSHPHRKLRDLATSKELKDDIHIHCKNSFAEFSRIYYDIEKARISNDPKSFYNSLFERIKKFSILNPLDPAKLCRIKERMRSRVSNYLTCLLYPGVACDNNLAERSLRHLVLKRKISFGSLTERTADNLAVLLSVLLSWRQRGELRSYLLGV